MVPSYPTRFALTFSLAESRSVEPQISVHALVNSCLSQFYRKSARQLNRAHRKQSRKYRKGAKPQSQNYHKARVRYSRKHLRVSRQQKEYCKTVAYSVIQSNNLVAYEDLNVKGLVRNRHLAKSISDAGWSIFRHWLEYFGKKYGKVTVAVPPQYTSQNCSRCSETVRKSLSVRTHVCPHCGFVADRDHNAAINILQKGLRTVGHTGRSMLGEFDPLASLEPSCGVAVG
ncbi:MAG: transposase [Synechococcales bacterium]|nr:transposase [Synechococcales bacterium]